ncbi:MAG: hypothetical protein AAGD28_10510 [Bacteroidota bacterium]
MSSVLIKQSAGEQVFYTFGDALTDQLHTGYELIFLPFAPPPPKNQEVSLSITEAWHNPLYKGTFAFVKRSDPALEQESIVADIQQIRQKNSLRFSRFLWLDYTRETGRFTRQQLIIDISGSRLSQDNFCELKNYRLRFPKGSSVNWNANSSRFEFSPESATKAFQLKTSYGASSLAVGKEGIHISMDAPTLGQLSFQLDIHRDDFLDQHGKQSFGYPAFSHLDVGMRLYFRDYAFKGNAENFSISSLRYPLFKEIYRSAESDSGAGTVLDLDTIKAFFPAKIQLHANWDPLSPLDEEKSYFAFDRSSKAEIPSGYRTQLGYTIHLEAQENCKLVFQERQLYSNEKQPGLTLVPRGSFKMSLPSYADPKPELIHRHRLICGLSGVEYLSLAPETEKDNFLHFFPGNPAFAPNYISLQGLTENFILLLKGYGTLEDLKQNRKGDDDRDEDLNIDNTEWLEEILLPLIADFFPEGQILSETEEDQWKQLEIVEDSLEWLQRFFLESTLSKANTSTQAFNTTANSSWAYITQSDDGVPIYFAQPDESVFYQPAGDTEGDLTDEFLSYLEVPAEPLPAEQSSLAFPLFPHGAVDGAFLDDYLYIEKQFITKFRRDRISEIRAGANIPASSPSTTHEIQGTTPQGLLASFSEDFENWKSLLLAKDTENKAFQWVNIGRFDPLRTALQSNNLFAIISKPDSVNPYFKDASSNQVFHQMTIEGWNFDFEPINSENNENKWARFDTVMILKYQERPLIDLIEDSSNWSEKEAFVGEEADVNKVQQQLRRQLKEAIANGESGDEKLREKYKALARAAKQANWTGIILLNVNVPTEGLPEELAGLAAGIDTSKFYAQYLSVETTQVLPGDTLEAKTSSLFGLIDYNDDGPAPDTDGPFNFQVRSLSIIFRNSRIYDFAAEIELTLDELFGESTRLLDSETGVNIIQLKGTAERHDDKITYSFGFKGKNKFLLEKSEVLEEVSIVKAQFNTDPKPSGDNPRITSRFSLFGTMNFRKLEAFDILSFGAEHVGETDNEQFLSFSSLQVVMSFLEDDPPGRTFSFEADKISFNLTQSDVREQSLYAKFPIKLSGLSQYPGGAGQTPSSVGFAEVKSPLAGGVIGNEWYAFTYQLDLGTLGALAGDAGMLLQIMVAWSPEKVEGAKGLFVGIRLPGFKAGKAEISLQGILKLVFKSIRFIVGKDENENSVYMLKIKKIALKLLVLTLPPNTQGEISIFGDPEGDKDNKSVGWYGAITRN